LGRGGAYTLDAHEVGQGEVCASERLGIRRRREGYGRQCELGRNAGIRCFLEKIKPPRLWAGVYLETGALATAQSRRDALTRGRSHGHSIIGVGEGRIMKSKSIKACAVGTIEKPRI
jgi:hypothetical protein